MESPRSASTLQSSSLAFKQLLANVGKLLERDPSAEPSSVGEVLDAAVRLYDVCVEDPAIKPAAIGVAVTVISTQLEVSMRAAAALLVHTLDLRGYKR